MIVIRKENFTKHITLAQLQLHKLHVKAQTYNDNTQNTPCTLTDEIKLLKY